MRYTLPAIGRLGAALVAVGLLAVASGCAPTPEADGAGSRPSAQSAGAERDTVQAILDAADISELCGDEPINIGVSMPQGPVNWSLESVALVEIEVAECPNVDLITTYADGDPQKAVANINSMLSRGVDAIIAQPVSGEAELPVYRRAMQAGVPVVTFVGDSGGVPGTDITDHVGPDFARVVDKWFDWLDDSVGSGTMVYLGGVPGAPITRLWFDEVKSQVQERPQYELVEPEPIDTDWDSAKRKTAMAALLAQHGRIDIVMNESNQSDRGTLDAYIEAGLELPVLVGVAQSNTMGCFWAENPWEWASTGGTQALTVVALRKALAAANDIEDLEASTIVLPFGVDTAKGMDPKCNPAMPSDTDFSVPLTDDERRAAFS